MGERMTRNTFNISLTAALALAPVLFGPPSAQAASKADGLELFRDKSSGRVVFIKASPEAGAPTALATPEASPRAQTDTSRAYKPGDPVLIADDFLARHRGRLGISDVTTELVPLEPQRDSLGFTHVRYRQMYGGLPVVGGEAAVHLNESGRVYAVSAMFASGIAAPLKGAVGLPEAEEIAAAAMKGEFALAGNPVMYSSAQVILQKGLIENTPDNTSYLAWALSLRSEEFGRAPEDWTYFVDAGSGVVLKRLSNVRYLYRKIYDCTPYLWGSICWINKAFPDLYPGYIFGRGEGRPVRGPNPVYGGTDVDDAYDTLIPQVHDYYLSTFGLNGGNNQGGMGTGGSYPVENTNVNTYLEAYWGAGGCPSASFDRGIINFCHGMVVPDIVGHEYSHGIPFFKFNQSFPVGMVYSGEPGALDESFSDVMGEGIEKFIMSETDWIMGTGLVANPAIGIPRSLINPPSSLSEAGTPYPDKLYSPYYHCANSFIQVHANATVPGKAFYLMSEGGTFNYCTINGIGINKVEQILYRAMMSYYAQAETFNAAYAHIIQAAEDLYGAADVAEGRKALQAVEMDQSGRCSGGTEIPPAADDRRALGISSLALASDLARASANTYRFRVWGIAEQVGTTMFNVNDGPGTVSVISSSLGSLSGGELVMVTGSLDTTFTGPTIRARPENIVTLAPAPEGVVYARAPVPAAAPAPELPFDSSRLQGTPDAASSDCGCGSSALPASLIASPGTPRNTSH